jgi:hypothetical protein
LGASDHRGFRAHHRLLGSLVIVDGGDVVGVAIALEHRLVDSDIGKVGCGFERAEAVLQASIDGSFFGILRPQSVEVGGQARRLRLNVTDRSEPDAEGFVLGIMPLESEVAPCYL